MNTVFPNAPDATVNPTNAETQARQIFLSVLIPAFNAAPYLSECVASVLDGLSAEDRSRLEVLICDDCSTDSTPEVIAQLQARYSDDCAGDFAGEVRGLKMAENSGPSRTRNALGDAAQGEYFWFLDSDDWLEPGVVSELLQLLQQSKAEVLNFNYSEYQDFGESGISAENHTKRMPERTRERSSFRGPAMTLLTDSSQVLSGIFQEGRMFVWARIFHRSLWQQGVRFPDNHFFEDIVATPALIAGARSFLHWPKPVVAYRQRAGSIMQSLDARKIDDIAWSVLALGQALGPKRQQLSPAAHFQFAFFCAKQYRWACIRHLKAGHSLTPEMLDQYRLRLLEGTAYPPGNLLLGCLQRLWLGSLLSLGMWLYAPQPMVALHRWKRRWRQAKQARHASTRIQ